MPDPKPRRPRTNEAAHKTRIAFLEKRGPIWQARMGLNHIEITHHYLDATSDMMLGSRPKNRPGIVRCGYQSGGGEAQYTAFVETRWNYQMADVYFILPSVLQWTDERMDQVLVHEYSHILCAPEQYLLEYKIAEEAADEEMTSNDLDALASLYYERLEMATENVARAVYSAWERSE